MSDNKKLTLRVNLLRSRKLRRVICLECGKEFADLLLSLLIMPVGTILKQLGEAGLVKSDYNGLCNLYKSMELLEASVFTVDTKSLTDPMIYGGHSNDFMRLSIAEKERCLNSVCENETLSKGQICDDCEAVKYNACSSMRSNNCCAVNFCNQSYGSNRCSSCGKSVSLYTVVLRRKGVQTSSQQKTTSSGDGATRGRGYVEKNITFMVKEDLSIIKSSALSALALLQSMKSDISDLDTKEVDIGKKEGLLLVRAAMISKKPLTDVFESFF